MQPKRKWRDYWSGQASPHHRSEAEAHYRQYAAELRILFGECQPKSVLEIGCGNGALYSHVGFDRLAYTGVDYSQSMLDDFRKKHPTATLVCADGASYRDENRYDLVFSNGVIQYFDSSMLKTHIRLAKSMLTENGRIVLASVPWQALKREYYRRGAIVESEKRFSWPMALAIEVASGLRKSSMGYWYSLEKIRNLAAEHSLTATFFCSMHYMYRFHAVLKTGRG